MKRLLPMLLALVASAGTTIAVAHAGAPPKTAATPPRATSSTAPRKTGTAAAAPKRGATRSPAQPPMAIAQEIRMLEEAGGYGRAAERLADLSKLVDQDADLEIARALDLARSGLLDSAAHVLASPILEKALHDTADFRRFQVYGWQHEGDYLNGKFDGWWWYVARGRAEVEASLGRWSRALEAARLCVRARPLAGVEWHVLATCAARTGAWEEADSAAARAVRLAPLLPEARHLAGLLAWRAGRRMQAQEQFRAAVGLDSTFRPAAVALVRSRLPVAPDSLPTAFLTGLRETALLASPARPKFDEFLQLDVPARLVANPSIELQDSEHGGKAFVVSPLALIDTHGRIVYIEDPWTAQGTLDEATVGKIMGSFSAWRFEPARRHGEPQALWMQVDMNIVP